MEGQLGVNKGSITLEAVIVTVELRRLSLLPLALGHVRHRALAEAWLAHEQPSDDAKDVRVCVQVVEERVQVVSVGKVRLVALQMHAPREILP